MKHIAMKITGSFCLAILFFSCQTKPEIEGTWTEPVPGLENQMQGFRLEKNGKASSVNMATLQYEQWKQTDDCLILKGTSIGNGLSFSFQDTFKIERLTADSLFIRHGNTIRKYIRENIQPDSSE